MFVCVDYQVPIWRDILNSTTARRCNAKTRLTLILTIARATVSNLQYPHPTASMRPAPCVLLLPAAVAAAKASLGNLYIYNDRVSGDKTVSSLKPDAARLVIASRLGLDQYHSLHGQDEASLQAIDRLSGDSAFVSSQHAASVALILSTVAPEG
jgi:hypothetical protein